MKIYVDFINKTSLAKTIMCCCGHRKYPMTLIAKLNIKGNPIMEVFSGIYLPKRRNYYKKDKQGYYYIPEVKQSEGISHPKAKAMGIRNAREI